MSKKILKKVGVCALTGNHGVYVKAHIIPLAVTRLEQVGLRVRQTGLDIIPGWRSTSWYDDQLVTQLGENILQSIDNEGINELKRNKLIWNGWDSKWNQLPNKYISQRINENLAVRKLSNLNVNSLRLLYLSILWRSISSNRKEMSYVKDLCPLKKELLRNIIINMDASDYFKFPMVFNQISTRGTLHNRTPIYEERNFNDILIGCYRIYFNGLICSIYDTTDQNLSQKFNKLVLGQFPETLVILNTWKSSREYEEMKSMIQDGLLKESVIKSAKEL